MTANLLIIWIVILAILFVLAAILIGTAIVRSRNAGRNVASTTEPMPDHVQRNRQTRSDQQIDSMQEQEHSHQQP